MPRLLEKYLPVITLAMSLPLFFSFQIKSPPGSFQGLPFVVFWSWGVLAAIILPILVFLEIVMCVLMQWHRSADKSILWRHGIALFAAVSVEVVFWIARRDTCDESGHRSTIREGSISGMLADTR